MACPDKNKDTKIVEEVARRKAAVPSAPETYQETHLDIDLPSLVQYLDTERLVSIHKTEQGWIVTKYV